MKLKIFISILLLYSISTVLFSQIDSAHTALVYGTDYSFMVKAPFGWLLDNKSGVSQGLVAVFYKEGSTWQNAVSVMYGNTSSKKDNGNETLQKVVDNDVDKFKKENSAEVRDDDNLKTKDNKNAIVKSFIDKKNKNYESVAYIDEKNVVVFLVLSSRDKSDYEGSLNAFREFVESYTYVTDNVEVKDK